MRMPLPFFKCIAITTLLSTGFGSHGIAQDTITIVDPETQAPIILKTSPAGGEMNIELGDVIKITFSNDMDESSINNTTLRLQAAYADTMYEERSEVILNDQIIEKSRIIRSKNTWQFTSGTVNGTISYSNKIAVFTPDNGLKEGTLYTFTVTNGVKDSENILLDNAQSWSFTTTDTPNSTYFDQQKNSYKYVMGGTDNLSIYAPSTDKIKIIDLGNAENFVILAKTSVHNESGSKITGHIGEGSITDNPQKEGSTLNSTLQSIQSDTTSPNVADAIEGMASAYSHAIMQHARDLTKYDYESFHSITLSPGVHEWSSSIQIISDVILSGNADDMWLFKTGHNLTVFENTVITLTNGARADNVFWYVEGEVSIGKKAKFEGIILAMDEIKLETGAILNGRMFSQSSITLDDNTITEPNEMTILSTTSNKE